MKFQQSLVLALVSAGLAACASPSSVTVPPPRQANAVRQPGSLGPIVQPKVPGEILGFDIDRHGNDGLLANYRDVQSGLTEVSVEVFDQRTGKITKVVKKQTGKNLSYSIDGILAHDVGLIDDYGTGYVLMNPVTGGKINGTWTPPIPFIVIEVAENQTTSTSVVLGYDKRSSSLPTALVVANVLKSTGSVIPLDQGVFGTGSVPTVAQDVATNQALITGGSSAPYTHPTLGIVNLGTGKTKTFTGLGYGSINGSGIDSKTGTACTTTNLDEGLEFYDLKTQSGFEVFIPNQGSQLQSGSVLMVDEKHHLCIVSQPVSTGGGTQQSAVWVYDEKGNELAGIMGFNFWFGAGMGINPKARIGYMLNPRPSYTTLTGFTY